MSSELSNDCLVAKFGFDTEVNEPKFGFDPEKSEPSELGPKSRIAKS